VRLLPIIIASVASTMNVMLRVIIIIVGGAGIVIISVLIALLSALVRLTTFNVPMSSFAADVAL